MNPGVNSDAVDIVSGLLNFGTDGFADAAFNDISGLVLFNDATVNLIPEPATAPLLGLGALGLACLRRRAQRAEGERSSSSKRSAQRAEGERSSSS